MELLRMDHVGITVRDLDAAERFFGALGFENVGSMRVGDERVDRIVGLTGVDCRIAMLRTPDGHSRIELVEFASPAAEGDGGEPVNVVGLRHVCFAVDDLKAAVAALEAQGGELVGDVVTYGDSYVLCYLRGPEGVVVELAEAVGA